MWEDPGRDTRRRLTVAEAADALGITVDAVRSRIKRGTIEHERKGGRVYVLLGVDESRPGYDQDTDQGGDQGTTAPEDRTAELIATLQEQLQAERQAHGEARRLLAAALERIPALEAPEGGPGSPERDQDEGDSAGVVRDVAANATGNVAGHLIILAGGSAIAAFLYVVQRLNLALLALCVASILMFIWDLKAARDVARDTGTTKAKRLVLLSYVIVTLGIAALLYLIVGAAVTGKG